MTTGGAGSAGTRPTLAPVYAPDGAAVEVASRTAPSPLPVGLVSAGLAAKLRAYDPKADTGLIDAAYTLAERAHGTQRRDNGDPYITHPLAVADILAGYRLDTASIATGLLHDVIEDTPVKLPEIQNSLRRRDRRAGGRGHQADPVGTAIRSHEAG